MYLCNCYTEFSVPGKSFESIFPCFRNSHFVFVRIAPDPTIISLGNVYPTIVIAFSASIEM